jgi:membrane-associated phospholipid phosphatase
MSAAFLILLFRGAPTLILLLAGALGQGLIFSTAYFRILAGRHFLTDVICGAIAGTSVALVVTWLHRSRFKISPLQSQQVPRLN